MFSKIFSFALILLAIAFQVQAHAAIAPALGVSGNPKRSDAKRPSNSSPCGQGVNIAGQINQSTAINAAADGSFTATVTNFNGYVAILGMDKRVLISASQRTRWISSSFGHS